LRYPSFTPSETLTRKWSNGDVNSWPRSTTRFPTVYPIVSGPLIFQDMQIFTSMRGSESIPCSLELKISKGSNLEPPGEAKGDSDTALSAALGNLPSLDVSSDFLLLTRAHGRRRRSSSFSDLTDLAKDVSGKHDIFFSGQEGNPPTTRKHMYAMKWWNHYHQRSGRVLNSGKVHPTKKSYDKSTA
jgi:hypothetical protein